MVMEKVNLYEATGPMDTNEGRGGTRSYGFYSQHDAAERAAKDKGVMGTPGYVKVVSGYVFYIGNIIKFVKETDLHDVLSETPGDVAARAKAKLKASLTEEEIKALGIGRII
jgi:hypothetical protein